MRSLLPPLLLLLIPPPTTPDWTSECVTRYPASCRCTWSSGKRLADCSKSNMNVLPVLSNEIQILDMTNNKLTQLQDNVFTHANMINLQKLYLKGCRINRVHELAFNNLRILVEIDLSHNEIEFIDPIIFSTNARLQKIKLNNNRLHTMREFPTLEYLNTIDLSHNQLTNLSHHTFAGLRAQREKLRLDLSFNQFTNINPAIFPPLGGLFLRGNAWVCDCELKALRDYVVEEKFYEPELRCSEPLNLFNSAWDAFDELSCKPEILHILANGKVVDSIVALENTLVLSCVVKGDPVPDVKWVKNGRVVQEAQRGVDNIGGVVVLNLTVGRHDNEFVCVGSNSGGVVERNLTVTLDEAGLSGFVVLKDGIEGGLGTTVGKDKGGLLIYLVIGVVFLSLVVGLVVGGVCVWRWGQRGRPPVEQDSVVKGVLKDTDERGDGDERRGDERGGSEGQREFLVEQTITGDSTHQLLHPLHPHHHHPPPPPSYYNYRDFDNRYYNNRNEQQYYRYYDYDDTQQPPQQATLTLGRKVHPNSVSPEMYDTVVYRRVQSNAPVSPDICDLIVPPPPPPPVLPEGLEYSNAPPPLEFCECSVDDKASRLQEFRLSLNRISSQRSSPQQSKPTSPLLKPHASADDLLDRPAQQQQRPTPDLLINGVEDELYNKFPQADSSSLYDNYEVVYRPLVGGGDSLRRYCFNRDYSTVQRPSSVCSEPRGVMSPGGRSVSNSPVIFPSGGYVTLPRRSMHKKKEVVQPLPIKYDNLGPRTTADGSSTISLNDDAAPTSHFEPIMEEEVGTPIDEGTVKKYRPVPPPKPKKKKLVEAVETADNSEQVKGGDDDDGTEV